MTGKADYLELGDWNAACYECGRKFKASQLIRHWQGYYVCKDHWESRQPQDFVRAVPDQQTPPWVQPMPTDTFVLGGAGTVSATGITRSGVSGVIIAGDGITTADRFFPDEGTPAAVDGFTSGPVVEVSGSGYTVEDELTLVGGTLAPGGFPTTVIVTGVTGGAITSVVVGTVGDYTTPPAEPSCTAVLSTFNSAQKNSRITLSNGDLTATSDSASLSKTVVCDIFSAAEAPDILYYELIITTLPSGGLAVGLANSSMSTADSASIGSDANGWCYLNLDGQKYHGSVVGTAYGDTWTQGDVISVVYDKTAQTISFWKNGIDQGIAFSSTSSSLAPAVSLGISNVVTINLGETPWIYTPPAGAEGWSQPCYVVVIGGTGSGAMITVPTVATVTYATYNPAHIQSYLSLRNSNLLAQSTADPEFVSAWTVTNVGSTAFQQTGATGLLRYCEFTDPFGNGFDLASVANLNYFGLIKGDFVPTDNTFIGSTSDSYGVSTGGLKWNNNSSTAYDSNGNQVPLVVGLLFDSVNGTLALMINGVNKGTAFTGISGSYCPAISLGIGRIIIANFGATAWTHEPPTGYVGWTS